MTFKKTIVALAGLGTAFGLVISLSTPVDATGYTFIGGSLGVGQRDFRVFNNFTDSQANNWSTYRRNTYARAHIHCSYRREKSI